MNVLERKKLKFHSFPVSDFSFRCRRTYNLNKDDEIITLSCLADGFYLLTMLTSNSIYLCE